jgi:hypothetical protein
MTPSKPPRPPFPRPPSPSSTPFGPGDQTNLDNIKKIIDEAKRLKDRLVSEQARLEKIRYGHVLNHGDGPNTKPFPVSSVDGLSRADSLLPFLLIRSFCGDIGARPVPQAQPISSPDIIVALPKNPGYQPTVLGRDDMKDFLSQHTIVNDIVQGNTYDIWVHVWNLGRAPAHGVRISALINGMVGRVPLGGRILDLGDRTSSTSHLVVKVGSWSTGKASVHGVHPLPDPTEIKATAECILDPAVVRDGSKDRHSTHRFVMQWAEL